MTVLLVLLTFAVFLALDAWSHRHDPVLAAATTPATEADTFRFEPVWVGGYQVPDGVHFHRGHTWARPMGNETAVVGLDDFARRLVGSADRVALPAVGTWVRSGDPAARLGRGEREAELVAPVEGVVVETNPLLERDPGLAIAEPYGRGWLYKVQTGELARNLRNLLTGSLAHRFIEDAREKLQLELMALSGSVLADGGEPAEDFASHLADDDWRRLTREFLLG